MKTPNEGFRREQQAFPSLRARKTPVISKIILHKGLLPVILVILSVLVPPKSAQAIGVNIGLYHSINPPSPPTTPWEYTTEQKPLISVDLFFSSLIGSENDKRFGLRVCFLRSIRKPVNPSEVTYANKDSYVYTLNSLLASIQKRLHSGRLSCVMLNVSMGFTLRNYERAGGISSSIASGLILAEIRLSFQPGLDFVHRIYKDLTFHLGGRFNLIPGNKEDIFPFSSGFLFEVGLALEQRADTW